MGHRGGMKSIVFSPNGWTLASASEVPKGNAPDRTVMLWDVD